METKPKTRTEQILAVMHVLAWVAYIAYLIKAGRILISLCVSWVSPDAADRLYTRMHMDKLLEYSIWYYTLAVALLVALILLNAHVWRLVIKILSGISMVNPFTKETAHRLERISYVMIVIWAVGMMNSAYTEWLTKKTGEEFGGGMGSESMYVAGLVFVIAQIFKRGIEMQSENELTV